MSEVGRAVWSYWSAPMAAGAGSGWLEPRHHLLSWVLSVETARRHFRTTALVTDTAGAALLVDGLGLQFDEVSTDLDALVGAVSGWWALGKLVAYRSQREPFVHVDSDAYLWSRLPDRLLTAPVMAQNLERFRPGASYYEPQVIEAALADRGWLPTEWIDIRRARRSRLAAVCCGILGGTDVEFLAHYAGQAIELVRRPENRAALDSVADPAAHVILIEQFLLWACLEHRGDVRLECLFASEDEAYQAPAAFPYTHLMGPAKRNPLIADRLERRVWRHFPRLAARAVCVASQATPVRASSEGEQQGPSTLTGPSVTLRQV